MSFKMNTKQTTYNKESRTFSTMASDIPLSPGEWPKEILMQSERTGKVLKFKFDSDIISVRGEFGGKTYWNLIKNLFLKIFND